MTDEELEQILRQERRAANPLSGQALLDRAEAQRRDAEIARRLGGGIAVSFTVLFAALLLLPRLTPADLSMKGAGIAGEARLVWVLESDVEAPRISPEIRPTDRVVFGVQGTVTGFACLDEQGPEGWTRVLPPSGRSWPVRPGRTLFETDGRVQAFRSDFEPGSRPYRLLIHADDPSCRAGLEADLQELTWLP